MSAIKDSRQAIMLDKERYLLFSLNVLDELQDKAGDINNLGKILYNGGNVNIKNLRWMLTLLLNEGAAEEDELLTEKQVGRIIPAGRLKEIIGCVFKAFSLGSNGNSTTDDGTDLLEDNEKNGMSEQGI